MQETLRLEQDLQAMTPVKKVDGLKEIVLQKKGSQQDGDELASDNFKLQSVGMTYEVSPLTRN